MRNSLLRNERLRKGWSQEHLADFSGVSLRTIQRAERGESLRPDSIQLLCKCLSKSTEDLGLFNAPEEALDVTKQLEISYNNSVEETDHLEQARESEEAVNRREATKKIAAFIGATTISTPHDLLNPQSWSQFSLALKGASEIENLASFTKLTETSWYLLKSSELDVLEKVLASYLPKLEALVQIDSKDRREAAGLTSQSYQIGGILASHQLNLDARRIYHQQAVQYSNVSQDYNVQAAALIQLASAFQYLNRPKKVQQTYQLTFPFIDEISPLLRSCVYLGLADASTQCGQKQEALRYLGLARETFPPSPEYDPAFLYADAGFFSLALYEGLTFLGIEEPEKAWNAFSQIEKYPKNATPERVRIEIINLQAETAVVASDLERFYDRIEVGRNGAIAMGSEKRYQEAYEAYKHGKQIWRNEPRIKDLAELFVR